MKKTILFDFDGTIANSFDNFIEIVQALSKKYKLPIITRSELEKLRVEDARSIITKLNIPMYKIPLLAHDMKKMQQEHITMISPYEGIPAVLQTLKNDYQLGIVTSNGKKNVEIFLTKHKLALFNFIYSDSSIFGKDKVLKRFLKLHDISKDSVIYVGDEIRDIHACKKVGIKIIAVTWGFTLKEGLVRHSPDGIVDTPAELVAALK